jgi:DNA-binding MarR family transcriptional regulator
MARLFHEVSGEGLAPLGIRPHQFPILVELWFGDGASRDSLTQSLEMDAAGVHALLAELSADGLIETVPTDSAQNLVLTAKASAAREGAIPAARRANQTAASVLNDDEMAHLLSLMNRVIHALQTTRTRG